MFVRGLKCEYLASNTISSKSFQTLPFHGLTNLTIFAFSMQPMRFTPL